MDKIATARINNLRISEADVPPEDPIFVLTASQLRQIITQAVQDAIQPLQDRIESLQGMVDSQTEKIAALEDLQEHEISRVCVDIAYDRQRIAKLEKVEPQPLQKDRGEILRALLVAHGGKMLAKDARKRMRVPKSSFSELLKTCDFVEKRPYHLDPRQDVLVLK